MLKPIVITANLPSDNPALLANPRSRITLSVERVADGGFYVDFSFHLPSVACDFCGGAFFLRGCMERFCSELKALAAGAAEACVLSDPGQMTVLAITRPNGAGDKILVSFTYISVMPHWENEVAQEEARRQLATKTPVSFFEGTMFSFSFLELLDEPEALYRQVQDLLLAAERFWEP